MEENICHIRNKNIKKKEKGINTPEHRRHPSLELNLSIIRRCFEDGEYIKSVSKDSGYSRTCIYL